MQADDIFVLGGFIMVETKIKVDMKNEVSTTVTEENTAIAMKSGSLPVFATPSMTALMEQAAAELVEGLVPSDWTSVGISLDIRHKAATPLGQKVRAVAEVKSFDGRQITFSVKAFDDAKEIGEGLHERVLVNREKFMGKVTAK